MTEKFNNATLLALNTSISKVMENDNLDDEKTQLEVIEILYKASHLLSEFDPMNAHHVRKAIADASIETKICHKLNKQG